MILPVMIIIAAIAQAFEDIIQYHFENSIFRNVAQYSFWGSASWVRKYKNGNPDMGRKFFGSKTFLVWLTDGWHLTKFIYLLAVIVGMVAGKPFTAGLDWWWTVLEGVVLFTLYGGVFELFYKFILRKQ